VVIGFMIIGKCQEVQMLLTILMGYNRCHDVRIHSFAVRNENLLTIMCRYLMMQALAELAVMYPINGAFTMYICRFIDPSWGFACGWQYGIGWLTVLPFEISAACNVRIILAIFG
jgi:hypothetical protein